MKGSTENVCYIYIQDLCKPGCNIASSQNYDDAMLYYDHEFIRNSEIVAYYFPARGIPLTNHGNQYPYEYISQRDLPTF